MQAHEENYMVNVWILGAFAGFCILPLMLAKSGCSRGYVPSIDRKDTVFASDLTSLVRGIMKSEANTGRSAS